MRILSSRAPPSRFSSDTHEAMIRVSEVAAWLQRRVR